MTVLNGKKIAGTLPTPPNTQTDGNVVDLHSRSLGDLVELRRRHLKLLNNKSFIAKLPDKGARIRIFYEKIVAELVVRCGEDETKRMLEMFDRFSVQDLEWKNVTNYSNYLNLKDEGPKEVQQTTKPYPLLSQMLQTNVPNVQTRNIFKPYKTTVSDVHDPEKEILRKKGANWEVTAATPPPIVHGPTKLLTLEESIKLQKDYNEYLKTIQATQAEEKLRRCEIKIVDSPGMRKNLGTYQDAASDDSDTSDSEDSENEVLDEEPEMGGVIFNFMN